MSMALCRRQAPPLCCALCLCAQVPTTAAETFFLSASDGDLKGMWFAVSPFAFQLSLPVVLVSLTCKAITGGSDFQVLMPDLKALYCVCVCNMAMYLQVGRMGHMANERAPSGSARQTHATKHRVFSVVTRWLPFSLPCSSCR